MYESRDSRGQLRCGLGSKYQYEIEVLNENQIPVQSRVRSCNLEFGSKMRSSLAVRIACSATLVKVLKGMEGILRVRGVSHKSPECCIKHLNNA